MSRLQPLALAVLAASCVASAASASVAVHVEYLDVPPEAVAQLEAELRGPVAELNRARLERGEIFAWYHYTARFPSGAARRYSDVIVTVFTDFSGLEDAPGSDGYARWVRDSEVYQGVPGVRSESYYGKVEYSHVTVDFLTAGEAGAEAFLSTMRDRIMPRLQARTDAGTVVNWALFARRLPVGSERGYEYALVSRFDGFGQLATPQIARSEATYLRESVVWELQGIIE